MRKRKESEEESETRYGQNDLNCERMEMEKEERKASGKEEGLWMQRNGRIKRTDLRAEVNGNEKNEGKWKKEEEEGGIFEGTLAQIAGEGG